MVVTYRTSGEVVAIETWSVWVSNLTTVPSSVHPEAVPPVLSSTPQTMSPKALVSRALVPEQEPVRLERRSPPPTTMPPVNVEEAEDPVTEMSERASLASVHVEVAVPMMLMDVAVAAPKRAGIPEASMEPPVMVSPWLEASPPPATESPADVQVEVALPVTLNEVPVAAPNSEGIPAACIEPPLTISPTELTVEVAKSPFTEVVPDINTGP